MLRFMLWLLGAALIVGLFLGLALSGVLGGDASFIIGWLVCGVYSVVVFCGIGGEPENVGGTSIIMILCGPLMLLYVLALALPYELNGRLEEGR